MGRTIVISSGSGCCECNQMVGCNCGSGCSLLCHSKEGIATLCGFDEMGSPSVPPRVYKKRDITGELKRCMDACATPPSCSQPIAFALSCSHNCTDGSGGAVTASAVWIGWTGSAHRYQMTSVGGSCSCVHGPCSPQATFNYPGFGTWVNKPVGSTFDIGPCQLIYLSVRWVTASGSEVLFTGSDVAGFSPPSAYGGYPVVIDTYDRHDSYDADSGCTNTPIENSVRKKNSQTTCEAPSVALDPLDPLPPSLDAQVGVDAVVEQTEAEYTGTETCGPSLGADPMGSTFGSASIELSEEDTEEAAIARVRDDHGDPLGWTLSDAGCANVWAYRSLRNPGDREFSFRETEVKAAMTGLTPGETYTVTIRFYRRLLDSLGPWIFFSIQEVTFTADATSHTIEDWQPVPNEAGWETRPQTCSVAIAT